MVGLDDFFEDMDDSEEQLHSQDCGPPYNFGDIYTEERLSSLNEEEFANSLLHFNSSLKGFVMAVREHWRKGKGNFGAVYTMLLMQQYVALEKPEHDYIVAISIASLVFYRDFEQTQSTFDPARVKVQLASFLTYCSSTDPGEPCPDFLNYLQQKNKDMCAALNLGERLGANEHLELKSMFEIQASFPNQLIRIVLHKLHFVFRGVDPNIDVIHRDYTKRLKRRLRCFGLFIVWLLLWGGK
jgi:hypothetical protein